MSCVDDITSAPFGPTSASAQFAANGACDWYGQRYVDDATCAAWAKAPAASPQSAITVSVVLAARMLSNRFSGSGGGSCHVTLSARAALTASHSRAATTPTKSPLRTTRAPAMSAIELSSMLSGFAPAP